MKYPVKAEGHVLIFGFVFFLLISVLTALLFKKINSRNQAANKKTELEIITMLEEAEQLSKRWNLGSVCLTANTIEKKSVSLSFTLTQDDMEKLPQIQEEENIAGWKLDTPSYSALPTLTAYYYNGYKGSWDRFSLQLLDTLRNTHSEWHCLDHRDVKIICF